MCATNFGERNPIDQSGLVRINDNAPSALGSLDLLGRMPVPLRRAFKLGLDQVTREQREAGQGLNCCFLSGGEWYRPFDNLARAPTADALPNMLVSTLYHDIIGAKLWAAYEGTGACSRARLRVHPACVEGGLFDPSLTFNVFSIIPFVFLVDMTRLRGRPVPSVWTDLFSPMWRDEIVFGGWRPNTQVPYRDYNEFLLLCLYAEYGASGLLAFASNVKHLVHNVKTTRQMGSNSENVGAIAILPWLHAELCPRRDKVRVIWPKDGALALPIGYMVKRGKLGRVAPLIDYLTSDSLGAILSRNCYPPAFTSERPTFPEGATLKWHGWDYLYEHDLVKETARAAKLFFSVWEQNKEFEQCG